MWHAPRLLLLLAPLALGANHIRATVAASAAAIGRPALCFCSLAATPLVLGAGHTLLAAVARLRLVPRRCGPVVPPAVVPPAAVAACLWAHCLACCFGGPWRGPFATSLFFGSAAALSLLRSLPSRSRLLPRCAALAATSAAAAAAERCDHFVHSRLWYEHANQALRLLPSGGDAQHSHAPLALRCLPRQHILQKGRTVSDERNG